MTAALSAFTVLLMVVLGLAMFRCLAIRLLAGRRAEITDTDLVLMGILPGLALVGAAVTYLSLFHLLRFGFMVFLTICLLYVLRRHVCAIGIVIQDYIAGLIGQARRGNVFPAIAAIAACLVLGAGLRLSTIPAENIDVWVFHIPLAQSFIGHHGFVYPQIQNLLFYSNQPLQFELLFATAMLAVPDFVSAGAVNVAVFFGLLLLILSFARRARDIQFLVLCFLFVMTQSFLLDAATPMIDLPRSCFSVAAYLFAYRYACGLRCFDLVMSALLAGAAVAGKYTELVTPLVITLTLIPLAINKRPVWFHVVPATVIFVAVAGYWYVKNALLFGNPIFPFLFGHPGLSDQWMSSYLQEMTRPFNPADRLYVTNLLTLRGWHDLAAVLADHLQPLIPYGVIALFGLLLPVPRRWILPFWCFVLFVFWYAVMFNAMRWVMSAMLLTLATAFIVWATVADRIGEAWNERWLTEALENLLRWLTRSPNPWAAFASLVFGAFVLWGGAQVKAGEGSFLVPSWMSRELVAATISPGRMGDYLTEHRPGYLLYRYIGQHDLSYVLQPFDNGGASYASAYNGGHANAWVLPYDMLPVNLEQTNDFVARKGIRFFVDRAEIAPIDVERLGRGNIARARAVIAQLKPHSRLVAQFDRGESLYEILPAGAPK